jgi:hypothetical protein
MVSKSSKDADCRQQNRSDKKNEGMHEMPSFRFCEEGSNYSATDSRRFTQIGLNTDLVEWSSWKKLQTISLGCLG